MFPPRRKRFLLCAHRRADPARVSRILARMGNGNPPVEGDELRLKFPARKGRKKSNRETSCISYALPAVLLRNACRTLCTSPGSWVQHWVQLERGKWLPISRKRHQIGHLDFRHSRLLTEMLEVRILPGEPKSLSSINYRVWVEHSVASRMALAPIAAFRRCSDFCVTRMSRVSWRSARLLRELVWRVPNGCRFKSSRRNQRFFSFNHFHRPRDHPNL